MKGIKIICQKKTFSPYLNWLFGFAFLFSILLTCCIAPSVSAYTFGDVGSTQVMAGQGYTYLQNYFNPTDGTKTVTTSYTNGFVLAAATGSSAIPAGGYISNVRVYTYNQIPAHSMFRFSLRVAGASVSRITPQAFYTSNGIFILNQGCDVIGYNAETSTYTTTSDIVCNFTLYTESATNTFYLQGNFATFTGSDGQGYIATMPQYIDYVVIESESGGGGGSIDTTQLADDVADILDAVNSGNVRRYSIWQDTQSIVSLLEDIEDGQLSPAGVESALEAEREAEEQITRDIQDDAQDSVNDSQDDVDSASATLIQQVSTLVTGLRQVQPSNCVIAFDLFSTSAYGRGSSAQAYNIDLCALSRPASFQVIDQILKVVWVVGAILMVLNAMLGLFREVQGGGE